MQRPLGSVSKQATPKKKSGRRRFVLFALVLAGSGFATAHIVHGSGAKHSANRHHQHSSSCRLRREPGSRRTREICLRKARRIAHIRYMRSDPLHLYAASLTPVLGKTLAAFDGAATSVGNAGFDNVDSVCGSYGTQISILQSMADGVPHPGPWYRPVSNVHRSLLGIYHDMAGALLACQTGAENQDSSVVAVAAGDIQLADEHLRQLDGYVLSLSH